VFFVISLPDKAATMVLIWAPLAALLALAAARTKTPLLDDGTRTRNKAAECVFGKQVRELGSQWIPDLGTPIGVLYCMKCECVALQKKRRVVARVQCRSIKNECPEPTCAEPVHHPERCCKTCPGDLYDSDIIQDVVPQNVLDDEEKSSTKHYSALLTERSSLVLKNDYKLISNNQNKNNVVATGRFSFHKKNLYFSFYISDKAARPRSLQFADSEGNILEEFQLSRAGGLVNSLYQNATRKVCGVWRRVPHEYRKRFRQEKMYVVLVWGGDFTLSGQVMKYAALATENFSSLLEPSAGTSSQMTGAGGTAMVSFSTSVSTSIYLAVVFNGLFGADDVADVPLNVTLSLDDKKYILQEVVRVKKPHYELNMIEVRSPVTSADLRLLTRGRLLLTVSSVSKPEALRLSGSVMTKVTCELFQTTLASSPSDHNPHGTSGLAWLYLNNEGSLVYHVQINNLRSTPDNTTIITLVDMTTRRRTELEDLTPSFDFANGWANGTLAKLSPKVLEPLYSGDLAVNVATPNDTSLIRGRLVAKPVAEARDAPAPFLLKRENYTLPTSAVGLAWLYVDNDCCIHYDVTLWGLGSNDRKLELSLELLPMLAPGANNITRHLDEFQGNQVEGSPVDALNREEINRLENGVGFLKVNEKDTKITLLAATFRHVIVPSTCQSPPPDNDVRSIDDAGMGPSGDCLDEGKFYQEEAQWTSSANPCTMCFCQNGVNKCFTMECPEVICPAPYKLIKFPGECCPICGNSTSLIETNRNVPQKCIFNGQPYSPGSKFHPFLIPNGFDSCTVCTCNPVYLEIKCTRISNGKECCKNCVDYSMNGTFPGDDEVPLLAGIVPRKEIPNKSAKQILAEGGCQNLYDLKRPYANGTEYHPSIDSLGEYKCVTCKCENGKPSCRRECDRAACDLIFKMKKKQRQQTGKWNSAQSCCTPRLCKKYRHKKNHRSLKS
jgi:chordin